MRQVVSFDKLKLTNNELDDQGHVSRLKKTIGPYRPQTRKSKIGLNLKWMNNHIDNNINNYNDNKKNKIKNKSIYYKYSTHK